MKGQKDQRKKADEYVKIFGLETSLDKEIKVLSGGELQRFSILIALGKAVKDFRQNSKNTDKAKNEKSPSTQRHRRFPSRWRSN